MTGIGENAHGKVVLNMENLRLQAIEKMEGDMIFCFECDEEEKAAAYDYIAQMSEDELIRFINE